ncbi:MAG: glycoside hydrolase family 13 protein [Clostridia bacterium]|nr:glycoside hydrolase family 13 protein [Clostridia bacterium]
MEVYHNSREEKYRFPKGAVPGGAAVRLSVEVKCQTQPQAVILRLWDGEEHLISMEQTSGENGVFLYSAKVDMPQSAGLVWYYFIVKADGKSSYYSNNNNRLGGVGQQSDYPTDISYQITVYDKDFKTPDWFKKSIMYQIFPDRFFKEDIEIKNKLNQYRMHDDWYEPMFFDKHPYENGPACNDFYGGNLKGIMSKLDYLKKLGISVIYLNPVFEAFSNHRYDTGDYSKIDPILGSEKDFKELCIKAEGMGIRIILDGVFSHTGSDSIYFNKYKTYGDGVGASQSYDSPYGKWFQWNDDGSYNSWWGCSNLPNVNELEPTYIDYIMNGENAIIKKWLKLGASGWRLDVADELPDEFIKILRREVKSQKDDAVVIGEVWEDASNKVSYSRQREYLFGDELDSVMNYPFKDGVIGFLTGGIDAEVFSDKMQSIMENYPKEVLYSNMNLLGTHDTRRVKTVLSGQYISDEMSREEKSRFCLDAANETLAIKRLKLAVFIQMTFVGVPCIYYGDEIGMQGLEDPFNRRPYTWRCVDTELLDFYKAAAGFRNSFDSLKTGGFEVLYAKDGVLVYLRRISGGRDEFGAKAKNSVVLCAVNRSATDCTVEIPTVSDIPAELTGYFGGEIINQTDKGTFVLNLNAFSAEGYVG